MLGALRIVDRRPITIRSLDSEAVVRPLGDRIQTLGHQSHDQNENLASMAQAEAVAGHEETLMPVIDRLLSSRDYPKTICPSEVPRALTASQLKDLGASDWRDLMPQVRELLWEMRQRGQVEILQKGSPLPSDIELKDLRGPIRARRT